jgi:hypothetical protein
MDDYNKAWSNVGCLIRQVPEDKQMNSKQVELETYTATVWNKFR